MIFKKPLLPEILVLAIAVSILHFLALTFYLYWTTWWFDILMHGLGGATIAILAMFLFYTSGYMDFPKEHLGSIFAMTLGSVLLVGLVWELWELFVGFSDVIEDQADTLIDLLMDMIGGIIAFSYGKKFVWKTEN